MKKISIELLKKKVCYAPLPKHIAIIMDGNGRWAQEKGLPRILGHRAGVKSVKKIVALSHELGIKILSLYAFSTENWKRPHQEVNFLMSLPQEYLAKELDALKKKNIQIRTCGLLTELPAETRSAIEEAILYTSLCEGMILNFAINYGSRSEILNAVKKIGEDLLKNKLDFNQLDEDVFSSYLYTKNLVDPDLLIRPSGEMRLSNFFLWQVAYTELWFTEKYWPDFNEEDFLLAILSFQHRQRRFGGLKTSPQYFQGKGS